MKLKTLILKNFRSFQGEVRISVDDLTALIGKNDAGKSTVLEALEIFFNGVKGAVVKMEPLDANVYSADKHVLIGCVFSDLPKEIVLDTQTLTSLQQEYLVNSDGDLEIHKVFDCGTKTPKESVFAFALHPTAASMNDLLQLSNAELKKRAREIGADLDTVDKRSNPDLRKAIRSTVSELEFAEGDVPLDKQNAKTVWESLSKALPMYALFRADRTSNEDDSEVQDPMKLAVNEAIKSTEQILEEVKRTVQQQVTEVAVRTLEKLKDMDPLLASELSPHFKTEPNWSSLFKLSLTSDDQIPINKRGSGVRRLILLNFFRAEAERKQATKESSGIIYGIEEPETAQHPLNQKMVISALTALSQQENCQVVLTTHVPGLAGYLETTSLRYVSVGEDGSRRVLEGTDDVYKEISAQLGVFPDSRVRVFVCTEGPHDVRFLKHISSILNAQNPHIPNLGTDPRVVLVHLGGSALKDWVQNHYLREVGRPEIHIYDKDDGPVPKYQEQYEEMNSRHDGSQAFNTGKRELENYLHPDAISEEFGFHITFNENDDVPLIVARRVHEESESNTCWDDLLNEKKKQKVSKAKGRLNNGAAARMSIERLRESDTDGEIQQWLQAILAHLEGDESRQTVAPTDERITPD